LKYDEQVEKA